MAFKVCEKFPPDIILLDINMPGMDGFEVCRRLKANSKTRDIPVLFVSALTEADNIDTGFAVGARDYIEKPIRPSIVLARVAHHLQTSGEMGRLLEQMEDMESKDIQSVGHVFFSTDPVTQLCNRTELVSRLERIVERAGRKEGLYSWAVLFIDLAKVWDVEKELGAEAYERFLREFSVKLKESFRGTDDIARLEGGQFVIVIRGLSKSR